MRVGIFTDTYRPQVNGVVTVIETWKRGLQERGHDVLLVYPRPANSGGDGELAVPSAHFPFYGGYYVGLPHGKIPEVLRTLDVVHTHTQFSVGAYGAYIASKFAIPRVTTYHTPVEEYSQYMSLGPLRELGVRFFQLWERKYMSLASFVTAPTPQTAAALEKKAGREVVVVSNGIDTDRYRRRSKSGFREKYGLNGTLVGFCGRHSYEKRLEDLIAVAERVKATVVITGDGPASNYYKKLAEGKKNVVFLGFIPDEEMPAFYSSVDVLVHPSIAEIQSLVVMEANACGTPVVGARAAGLRDTIRDGVNGFLYEPGDLQDLKRKIDVALNRRRVLSKTCVAEARKHSIERTIDKLEDLYSRAEYRRGSFNHSYLYKPLRLASFFLYKTLG